MNLLLDTHVLLWAAGDPERLSAQTQALIQAEDNTLHYSVASLWEVAIKNELGRTDFRVDPHLLRRGLQENGYRELEISAHHVLGVTRLPPIHKDPFDRLLIAQAEFEGFLLLTADAKIGQYPGPIQTL